jgi:hypothetical protein
MVVGWRCAVATLLAAAQPILARENGETEDVPENSGL